MYSKVNAILFHQLFFCYRSLCLSASKSDAFFPPLKKYNFGGISFESLYSMI